MPRRNILCLSFSSSFFLGVLSPSSLGYIFLICEKRGVFQSSRISGRPSSQITKSKSFSSDATGLLGSLFGYRASGAPLHHRPTNFDATCRQINQVHCLFYEQNSKNRLHPAVTYERPGNFLRSSNHHLHPRDKIGCLEEVIFLFDFSVNSYD